MPNILRRSYVDRETFDPTNEKHLESFDVFIRTGNWGAIQFYSEPPYNEVPMTCLMKFAEFHRKVEREQPEERDARLSTKPGLLQAGARVSIKDQRRIRAEELAHVNKLFDERLKAEFARIRN